MNEKYIYKPYSEATDKSNTSAVTQFVSMGSATAKKDDDHNDEMIQMWLDLHKIESGMDKWPTPQVETFVKSFISQLPKDQLTASNIESVQLRFRELSKASGRARYRLFAETKDLPKIDKTFRKTLVLAVISSSSNRF